MCIWNCCDYIVSSYCVCKSAYTGEMSCIRLLWLPSFCVLYYATGMLVLYDNYILSEASLKIVKYSDHFQ